MILPRLLAKYLKPTESPPIFSVVVATFGRDLLILSTLESIRKQDFQNFEVLIVSDGKASRELRKTVSLFDERFKLIELKERSGSQAKPNTIGWTHSSGIYISYLGHDDLWQYNHLSKAHETFVQNPNSDFVISGCVMPGPPGVKDFCWITGMFEDQNSHVGLEYFFPPSSISHKRELSIGVSTWPDPNEVRRPVDSEFLYRASKSGSLFSSTQLITVIKFNSALRYLSYLFKEDHEQRTIAQLMENPEEYASWLKDQINTAKNNKTFLTMKHPEEEAEHSPGKVMKRFEKIRGLEKKEITRLREPVFLMVNDREGGFDWHQIEVIDGVTSRWSGPSPKSKVLVPVVSCKKVVFLIYIKSFISTPDVDDLKIRVNGDIIKPDSIYSSDGNDFCFTLTAMLGKRHPSIIEFSIPQTHHIFEINPESPDSRAVGFLFQGIKILVSK